MPSVVCCIGHDPIKIGIKSLEEFLKILKLKVQKSKATGFQGKTIVCMGALGLIPLSMVRSGPPNTEQMLVSHIPVLSEVMYREINKVLR